MCQPNASVLTFSAKSGRSAVGPELAAAGPAPIASEALLRIAELYRIEDDIRGQPAEARRTARLEKSRPIVAALEPWLREKLGPISQRTKLAEAIRYTLSRWEGLTRFVDDGRIEIDSHPPDRAQSQERAFEGSDRGRHCPRCSKPAS